ncbi:Imm63 family immunity protein [Kitasatospora sp. NPDC056076]|uniref:Imm63 family immunity protein n=1 Tax=Kitasatospora sp. NPDC056076 TaxID=3345703 RepID=UPI0035D6C032
MGKGEAARMRQHLETEIARLSAVVGLTGRDVPTFDNRDGACPFISVGGNGWLSYLALERGELCFQRSTRDPDELLYWAFDSATRELASRWVLKHPREGEDQRVTRWRRHATLLHALHPAWAQRWRAELIKDLRDEDDHRLVPALPPPPLVLGPPEPPVEGVLLPVRPHRWWSWRH